MTKLIPICIKLPPTMLAAVDELADKPAGKSRTAVITRAIEALLLDGKLKRQAWIQIREEQRTYTARRHARRKVHP